MSKIIYHGSQNIIEAPQFGVGKLHNGDRGGCRWALIEAEGEAIGEAVGGQLVREASHRIA